MAESHGQRRAPETAAQTHGRRLRQAYECWQCGDFAMVDSHGTREFIGGGSGDCGTPMGGHAWILPWLNHTERVNS